MTKECLQEALKTKSHNPELVEILMESFVPGTIVNVAVFRTEDEFLNEDHEYLPCKTFDEYKLYVNQILSEDCRADMHCADGHSQEWLAFMLNGGFPNA